ncbi:hypothetical protein ACFLYF_02080 [Chloroflexota bacterium]
MDETDRLQKLVTIATDLTISGEIRTQAILQLGKIGSHEALVALLDMVGNESLMWEERMRALKQAERILKSGRQSRWYSFKSRSQD